MRTLRGLVMSLASLALPSAAAAIPTSQPATRPSPKPVPTAQIVPQPYDQAAFIRDGVEVARYHFGKALNRPFLFPLVGPSGRSLTRIGHPRDPVGHSHHDGVWVSHHDVDGVSFWDNKGAGRIVHQSVDAYEDGGDPPRAATAAQAATAGLPPDAAAVRSTDHWVRTADDKVLLVERRRTEVRLLAGRELLVLIDLQLEAPPKTTAPVTLGKTPFGLVGVRMAKTVGVNDGGGTLRNSEGGVVEKDLLWKPARWCDYSGPIATAPDGSPVVEGITLMDHPANPNHPTGFHVRADGWMGTSLTLNEARTIEPGKPLKLRYGLYVHAGQPGVEALNQAWEAFGKLPAVDLAPAARKR
jgi:hypothetical protein